MKKNTGTHKGYNEHNPTQAKGAFTPESNKEETPLAQKPRKEKPAVAEKKMKEKR